MQVPMVVDLGTPMATATAMVTETTTTATATTTTIVQNHCGYRLLLNEGLHWPSRLCWAHHDKLLDRDLMILVFPLFRLLPKERLIHPSHIHTTLLPKIRVILPNPALRRRQRMKLKLRLRLCRRVYTESQDERHIRWRWSEA